MTEPEKLTDQQRRDLIELGCRPVEIALTLRIIDAYKTKCTALVKELEEARAVFADLEVSHLAADERWKASERTVTQLNEMNDRAHAEVARLTEALERARLRHVDEQKRTAAAEQKLAAALADVSQLVVRATTAERERDEWQDRAGDRLSQAETAEARLATATELLDMLVPDDKGVGFYFDALARRKLWDLCEQARREAKKQSDQLQHKSEKE